MVRFASNSSYSGGDKKSSSSRLIGRDVVMVALGAVFTAIVMNLVSSDGPTTLRYESSLIGGGQQPQSTAASSSTAAASAAEATSSSGGGVSSQVVVDGIEPAEGWHPIHVFYGKMNHLLDPIPSDRFWVPGSQQNNRQWFSQHGQEVAVMKALDFPENGFFIDLAANDAVWASNTFVLEQHFGWNGICIEPNPMYWYRLAFRKCHALGTIVGANDFEEVEVMLGSDHNGPYSGIVGNEFDNKKANAKNNVKRYTAGLRTLLKRFNAPPMIDYLSLDVEGAETFIMKGFPFDEYKFKVLTIERPKEELQGILTSNGYKKVMELKRGDTLWAHETVYESAVANVAKNPDEIKTKVIQNWPQHVANKA